MNIVQRIILSSILIASFIPATFARPALHNTNTNEVYIGGYGGWIYPKHYLLAPTLNANDEVALEFKKLSSEILGRVDLGIMHDLYNALSVKFGVAGGYYGKYRDILWLFDTDAGLQNFTNVGFDLHVGLNYQLDNVYVGASSGLFMSRLANLSCSPTDDANGCVTLRLTDINPLIQLEVGYQYRNIQLGFMWMHVFTLHGSQKGSFVGEVAPAIDTVMGGINILWNGLV